MPDCDTDLNGLTYAHASSPLLSSDFYKRVTRRQSNTLLYTSDSRLSGEHAKLAAAKVIPKKDFEQFATFWTAEPGWHTELQLRNNLAAENLSVTPSLRTADGSETQLSSVSLLPGEVKSINVMDALSPVNSNLPMKPSAYGSLVLRYHSKSSSNLYASVMVHETGFPIIYHFDGMVQAPGYATGSREGIWWLPSSFTRDYLVLTNQSERPIKGTLWLYDASGRPWNQLVKLGARQTQRLSVRELVASAGFTSQYGGIKVEVAQGAGSLDSVHLLFDEAAGFSATMKMFDYDPQSKIESRDYAGKGVWIMRAPMLALSKPDPVLAFPPNTKLQPMLLIRNTAGRPVKVNLSFHWRSSSKDGRTPIPEVVLAPYESRKIDVEALQNNGLIPLEA